MVVKPLGVVRQLAYGVRCDLSVGGTFDVFTKHALFIWYMGLDCMHGYSVHSVDVSVL